MLFDSVPPDLEKINEAWKNASEELYKAQAETQNKTESDPKAGKKSSKKDDDDVQDVDFEEVK